ncbi:hypothetical protein [Actinokineospora inagensis]|uniref:hypothetical protein n=1 Tax=Actinokineospora inagensis TaxID=103730 RepID=UPI0012FAD624|nr:hypothetical protein [Actinokineospora inagensis]
MAIAAIGQVALPTTPFLLTIASTSRSASTSGAATEPLRLFVHLENGAGGDFGGCLKRWTFGQARALIALSLTAAKWLDSQSFAPGCDWPVCAF